MKDSCSKEFGLIHRKTPLSESPESVFNKVVGWESVTLCKKDSATGVLL